MTNQEVLFRSHGCGSGGKAINLLRLAVVLIERHVRNSGRRPVERVFSHLSFGPHTPAVGGRLAAVRVYLMAILGIRLVVRADGPSAVRRPNQNRNSD